MEVGRSAQANPYLERLVKKDDLCRMFVMAFLGNMLETLYSKECVHSFCSLLVVNLRFGECVYCHTGWNTYGSIWKFDSF